MIYTMRYLFTLISLFSVVSLQAQVRWQIYAGAGTSHNVFKGNSSDIYYDYYAYRGEDGWYILPHAGAGLMVPIGKRLLFEAGLSYTKKQFRAEENKIQEINTAHQLNVTNAFKTRLHYLGVPLTLSYIFRVGTENAIHLGAGINYNFLVAASGSITSRQNMPGSATSLYEYEVPVKRGFIQTSKILAGTLNIFDTGLRLQTAYVWHSKLSLRFFTEYSLYTIYLRGDRNKPDLQLWNSGLSLGYIF